ncbi:MAG: exopolysaccharide biosynthesis polyprenyl glycosylphosphotransferase [Cyclobacteriaceae bacterium]
MSALLKILFFIGDSLFLNASILFSFSFIGSIRLSTSDKAYLLVFSNLAWLFLVLVSNPYNLNKGWSVSKTIKSQLAFIFIHLLVVASLIFFFNKRYSTTQIGMIYAFFVPLFFSWKIIVYYFRKVFTSELLIKNYIILGKNEVAYGIRKHYLLNPQFGYRFSRYFDTSPSQYSLEEIRKYCVNEEVHEIFYCITDSDESSLKDLINFGLDSLIKVKIVVDSLPAQNQAIQLERFENKPGFDLATIPLDESGNQLLKRIFDLIFSAAFLLLIMSWLLPIIYIVIKTDSKGPIFFTQLRSGKDNRPFKCLKFRTMIVNKDSDSVQATKDDPRITKLGHFLRKTSIDELPQFINVFIGNMSVVGPRPHMLKHTEQYSKLIEKFLGRHYVKPGITGLAQCMGYRGETRTLDDMENRVRLDRYYIENWSFWFDIKIIFLTIVSLIRGSDKAF